MAGDEPTLMFFRNWPKGWPSNGYIASSLQSLETSFLLIALHRFPHALVTCASAIENVLLAKFWASNPNIKERTPRLSDLIKKATKHLSILQKEIDNQRLNDLLDARNTFVHRGFNSDDDSRASDLYIDVALPFLSACYQHLYSFDLSGSLLPEVFKHIDVARRARESVEEISNLNISYCLHSFSHLIRWGLKPGFSATWESDAQAFADSSGIKWDHVEKERSKFERLFGTEWSFDCPVCEKIDSAVTEISEFDPNNRFITLGRMACIECNFWVGHTHAFLSNFLFEEQLAEVHDRIFKEYGLS